MQAKYPTGAVKYCTDTWLIWKENLITAWINRQPHFGVIVTSPVEGCHATLKGYLQRGHGDLRVVYNRLKLLWEAQHSTIQSTVAQQQLRPRYSVNIPLFTTILQHVHTYALQLIFKEKAKLPTQGRAPPYCNCSTQESMGLPCHHTIWQRQQESGVIRLEDIHPHWYIIRPESGTYSRPTILHPLPVCQARLRRRRGGRPVSVHVAPFLSEWQEKL